MTALAAPMPGFCRDCLTVSSGGRRCRACGSPRIATHAELFELAIAHVDCDAFYAAIEKRDDPALRGRPALLHHHDPPWQRDRFAHVTELPVDDPAWRWHVGLDATATALLNDLYQGRELDAQRQQQLISLFTLRFDHPQDMRGDVQGKPVYLGLAMNEQGLLKLKPQNLLLNLPLASVV